MLRSILAIGVLLALAPAAAVAQGPISGIQTIDFGTGCGFGNTPIVAFYGFDALNSNLEVKVTANPGCCNTFFQGIYLMYGQNPLPPSPLTLPNPPFFLGCNLYIIPDVADGMHPGMKATIPVPPNPILIGQTFDVQVLGQWFTTIGFTLDFGVSQATSIMFV
jgi:hypothetical protein